MRLNVFYPIALAGALGGLWLSLGRSETGSAAEPSGVAVVELFTSEGCSSCPSADKLLGEIVKWADRDGKPVVALAFHVDYWDQLGWKDRFATPEITKRQQDYGAALKLRSIYTPQMIVNGQAQFVGSDGKAAEKAITAAFTETPAETLKLTATKGDGGKWKVNFGVGGAKAETVVNVALVERAAESRVTRGENSGSRLTHVNVVRSFTTATPAANGTGEVTVALPEGLTAKDVQVIAYVQDAKTKRIATGTRIDLE